MTTKTDPFQAMLRTAAELGYIGTGKPGRVPASDPSRQAQGVSPAQRKYIVSLMDAQVRLYARFGKTVEANAVQGIDLDALMAGLNKFTASAAIDQLKVKNMTLAAELAAAPAPVKVALTELEDGVYKLDGNVVRVYHTVHGSNQQVAGYWVPATDADGQPIMVERKGKTYQNGDWDYRGKAPLRRITPEHKMPVAEAEEFGQVYGRCCKCGRVLTLKVSIDRGLGSVCAGWF